MDDIVDVNTWVPSVVVDDSQPEILSEPDTTECLYCGEIIKVKARKCKHCGEFFDANLRGQSVIVGEGSVTPQVIVQNTNVIEARRPIFSVNTYSKTNSEWNPGIAAILSFFVPGAGQMYKGQVGEGVAWFFGTIFGYVAFIVPGLIIHLLCIIMAATNQPRN